MKNRWAFNRVNQFIAILFLLSSSIAGAYAACCSGHGGVASCNKTTGYQMCKDGTASPTCKCKKEKSTTTTIKKTTTTTTPTTSTTTTKSKSSGWGVKSTTTKPKTTTTTKSVTTHDTNKGCCSKHGGVGQCNASTGFLTCKDGTQSPSCTCH
ncbi:hypothetical protein OQJ18_02025 [Fluoribacter dumoffii]|nr:hypothetical protein [Fluoribacter dumoffii]MCW8386084.1 hypothetical protein [Fluoribacter dumoffii]MCW8419136.1 hypothetical protein [Fluoribacter dumoffii]MCW8453020.1 hypothetical protein [Fluoribacter dumoffii]MCW8459762.1 hypothetical protein [Fluoribacter dumoffii]MCW8483119.1 hypothetical protein [Fluoribacter dumoffii]